VVLSFGLWGFGGRPGSGSFLPMESLDVVGTFYLHLKSTYLPHEQLSACYQHSAYHTAIFMTS
jgi:hypothetical protein